MNPLNYRVRRATLEDLKALTALWEGMQFPVADLEKRLTEFQVAETEAGQIAGAIGLQITGRHGRLHSEAFVDFAQSDNLRHLLWTRLQNVAINHGLTRLWLKETAPFWDHNGFLMPDTEALEKLPAIWNELRNGSRTLKLKDEPETVPVSVDKEFALFMESEKGRTQDLFRHARTLKSVATLIAIILFLMVIAMGIYYLKRAPR